MKKILALLSAAFLASVSMADTVSVDFESYADGAIANGYDGWQITNSAWDQQVVSSGAISGNKSWRMSSAVTSGSFGDQPFRPALTQKAGENETHKVFEASWKWKPLAGGKNTEGITVSIDDGTGPRGNWIRLENLGGLDTSWRLSVFDYDGTGFVATELANNISAGTVLNLGFKMTFNAGLQNDVWEMYLNNTLVYTGVGWEDYFVDAQPSIAPVSYDRLLFRSSGTATPGAAGILTDDITYTSSVPEPATMTILAIAAAMKRRKAKKAQA